MALASGWAPGFEHRYCALCEMWLNGDPQYSDHITGKKHINKLKKHIGQWERIQWLRWERIERQWLQWSASSAKSEVAGLRSALDRRGRALPESAWKSIRSFLETPREFLMTYLGERQF